MEKGNVVKVAGKLKAVVDFLASADDETLKLLYSFLQEKDPIADAKALQKPLVINKLYKNSIEVTMGRGYVFEEKTELFEEATSKKMSKLAAEVVKESKRKLLEPKNDLLKESTPSA